MAIRLLITDDHALIRAGLVQYLALWPDIEIVAEAANGVELLEKLHAVTPDLLLPDFNMPGKNGADLISSVRSV